MAAVDIPGFVTDFKDHVADHGFHVHDERHFVETYSLRQAFEVDLHPDHACGGPLDMHVALDLDPRAVLAFEDAVMATDGESEPADEYHLPLLFNWALPPLPDGPDLLVLATELAGIGGTALPVEVSAIDNYAAVTDSPQRTLTLSAKTEVSLASVFAGKEQLCEELDRCHSVCDYLLARAPGWLGEI